MEEINVRVHTSKIRYVTPRYVSNLPEWTMPATNSKTVRMDFDLLAGLDRRSEDVGRSVSGHDMLLLLSTCRSHEAAFNACAYEVDCWLKHERFNFDHALSTVEALDWQQIELDSGRSAQRNLLFGPDDDPSVARELIVRKARMVEKFFPGPHFSTILQNCREYLSEFKHKRELFYDHFDDTQQALSQYCASRDLYGSIFWEHSIQGQGFLNGAKIGSISSRFKALDVVEALAWRLMDCLELLLARTGAWIPGGPDGDVSAPPDLTSAVQKYNAAVDWAIEECFGPWAPRYINLDTDLPRCISVLREGFTCIRRFFNLLIPLYEANSDFPYLPRPGKTQFRGFKEELLRKYFLLVIDIIRSKQCDSAVKSEILSVLGDVRRVFDGYQMELTGDDAYLIVTPKWEYVLSVIRLLKARTDSFLSSTGFGGLRCSATFGDCLVRVYEQKEEPILMDRPGEPCIPIAAYLNDQAMELLEGSGLGEEVNNWLVIDRCAAEAVCKSTITDTLTSNGFRHLGSWEHKTLRGEAFGYPAIHGIVAGTRE